MRINNIEYITETYHEWKKEKEEFTKFLHEKTERILKDRANNDVPDNGRQEVSKWISSSYTWKHFAWRKR